MSTTRSLGQALARASPRTSLVIGVAPRAVLPVSQQHEYGYGHGSRFNAQDRSHPRTTYSVAALELRSFFSQLSPLRRQPERDSDAHPAQKSATHHSGYGNSDEGPAGNNDVDADAVAEKGAHGSGTSRGNGKEGQATESTEAEDSAPRQSNVGNNKPTHDAATSPHVLPDAVADDAARGRTGGGEPLSSSANAPPQPKILNASVPGGGQAKLTKEQQEEVDRHNQEFKDSFDHAEDAPEDKVNKKFWSDERASD